MKETSLFSSAWYSPNTHGWAIIYNVKRVVFIILTLSLLLLSEAVTLLATHAAAPRGQLKGSVSNRAVQVQSLDFYYKMDEKSRYLDLKNQWQSAHKGELNYAEASTLAAQAYDESSVESELEQWAYHGGPDPKVMTGKVHIYNVGQRALLNLPIKVTLRAKVGELRVNPAIQMIDYDYLNDTAQWLSVSSKTVKVAALAPGEDMLVDLGKFQMLDFLGKHPNQWPAKLELRVDSPEFGTSRKVLNVIPDHFVVPVLY